MASNKHIVDILIEERAPKLASLPIWPMVRFVLNALLNYRSAVAMADKIALMDGVGALEEVSKLLSLRTTTYGFEHIPVTGGCIVVANHPTGIADGITAWDALKIIRPDVMFYANADAHRVCPRFSDVLIPVEWALHKRTREKTRETLRRTQAAFDQSRAVFIFPAGRLARMKDGVLFEPDWMVSAVTLARKYQVPIIPMYITGPASPWFHFFNQFSSELRDITLFKELLNKNNQAFVLTAGASIAPDNLAGNNQVITQRLQDYVTHIMPNAPDQQFR